MEDRNVVLMSDFGIKDGAAMDMEAVVDRICPSAKIKHLTHGVETFDIREGAFLLLVNYWHFRRGSIFVVVVDPGVGTDRKMVLVETDNYCFIGPDNGIFWPVIEVEKIKQIVAFDGQKLRQMAYEATDDEYFLRPASTVFEGRDYFAVAGGLFALGLIPTGIEISKSELVKLNLTLKKRKVVSIGEVIFIDDFGNLIVGCTKKDFYSFVKDREFVISLKDRTTSRICKNYAEGNNGELIALFGGDFEHPTKGSFLEIAICEDNVSERLDIHKGDKVTIERR